MRIGLPHTEETKQKISRALTGRTLSDAHRANISKARTGRRGKPRSEETKRKISMSLKGRKKPPLSKDHRQKLSEAGRGRWHTDEVKQKISMSLKGRKKPPRSDEHKHKLSKAWQGRKHTEEAKRRMSETQKARWVQGAYSNCTVAPPQVIYNGIPMRSSWEARLAQVFDALGWEWEYEPCKFQYELDDGPHTYTPDFYVPHLNCYFDPHWVLDDASAKFSAVRKQRGINLIVLDEKLLVKYEGAVL